MSNKYSINDFTKEDFDNPISLLSAMKKKGEESSHNNSVTTSNSEPEKEESLLTIEQIVNDYDITEEQINAAINKHILIPARSILLFSRDAIKSYLDKTPNFTLFHDFMYEMKNMRLNYSYKPVFILSLLDLADNNGVVSLLDMIEYFQKFYNKRQQDGLLVEQQNSSFVKYCGNYNSAKKTIVTYPLKIFTDKGFVQYDPKSQRIVLVKAIWQNLTPDITNHIRDLCHAHISTYFSLLSNKE